MKIETKRRKMTVQEATALEEIRAVLDKHGAEIYASSYECEDDPKIIISLECTNWDWELNEDQSFHGDTEISDFF